MVIKTAFLFLLTQFYHRARPALELLVSVCRAGLLGSVRSCRNFWSILSLLVIFTVLAVFIPHPCSLHAPMALSTTGDAIECIKWDPRWFKGYLRLALAYLAMGAEHEALGQLQLAGECDVQGQERVELARKHRQLSEVVRGTKPRCAVC